MRLLKIGHDVSCDIVINSPHVSSLHAEITLMNSGDILLEDKNSRNGTFVMNQRIASGKPVNIRRGDIVKFADVELQWSQVPMPEDNSAYRAVYGIGSNFNNDIQISGNTVSRYHATLKEGKDGKMYIIDHSKNGTTVDGMKIPSNTPVRIKRKSAVVCGGVPVDLSRYFKTSPIKPILIVAASVLVLVGIGLGVWKLIDGIPNKPKTYTEGELFERFNHSVVMSIGIYHYEISVGNFPMEALRGIIPQKVFYVNGITERPVDITDAPQKQFVELINRVFDNSGLGTGTAFFISNDGKLITNLHIAKPWLFTNDIEVLRDYYTEKLAKIAASSDIVGAFTGKGVTGLTAYVSQVKVVGVLDEIAIVPQGELFDPDNFIKCHVLSAGEDINKDVALIQTKSKRLPTSDCTFVNVVDSMNISDDALKVGSRIYTIGFPLGKHLQTGSQHEGLHVVGQDGKIIQESSEFEFGYNAPTFGGASGSPVFNEFGMLIGVHHAGFSQGVTQGYNMGIKSKYVKELLDNPYRR